MNPPTEWAAQRRAMRRFSFGLIGLFVVLIIGSAGYRWLEGMDFLDALYMTVITISTVGFGEIKPLSPGGRILTMALIISGALLAAYTLTVFGDLLASGEWRARWEHQKRMRMLAQLNNHIIVCGYGRVGKHVAHELTAEGLPFIVIDVNAEAIAHVGELGRLGLHGNAADETLLKQAGIERARGLVAAVNSDAENVFIVLTARSLCPDLLIIARANYEESESKLMRAGANHLIQPYRIAGRRMVTWLVRPAVADFLDDVTHAGGLELLLEQVHLAPTSALVGQTLAQAQLRERFGVTVLACRLPDGCVNTNLEPNTVLQAESDVIALGTREQLQAVIKLARG